jgi:hypothetical protein
MPAELFPEGNWGAPQNGFQLSIRFEKQNYVSGEPVVATILLRNVTNSLVKYTAMTMTSQSSPIGLIVADEKGKLTPVNSDDVIVSSVRDVTLYPGTQNKFEERLDTMYNLQTNQNFTVNASLVVGWPHRVEIQSAKVSIKIESTK